jgi:hypothetical protein
MLGCESQPVIAPSTLSPQSHPAAGGGRATRVELSTCGGRQRTRHHVRPWLPRRPPLPQIEDAVVGVQGCPMHCAWGLHGAGRAPEAPAGQPARRRRAARGRGRPWAAATTATVRGLLGAVPDTARLAQRGNAEGPSHPSAGAVPPRLNAPRAWVVPPNTLRPSKSQKPGRGTAALPTAGVVSHSRRPGAAKGTRPG